LEQGIVTAALQRTLNIYPVSQRREEEMKHESDKAKISPCVYDRRYMRQERVVF
jgi:hypothetical protein